MKRCLILNCSKTKTKNPELLPAIQRYNGPAYRVFRLFQKIANPSLLDVDLYIISAKFGLISGDCLIGEYDQLLSRRRAVELKPQVLTTLSKIFTNNYQEIFISMSKEYLTTINGYESLIPQSTKIIISNLPEGKRLSELKLWLYKQEYSKEKAVKVTEVTGQAVLKGKIIKATSEQIIDLAQKSLKNGNGYPFKIKEWYTIIDMQKVSPKWLVSVLSGLDVSEFQSSDARRVLSQLGIFVKHI
jgi:hypothetical protein